MAKKNFKGVASTSMQVPKIAQTERSKQTKEVKEKRKVTTILVKPSIYKRFKMVCLMNDFVIGDEQEGMFLKWLEEQEK